MSYLVLARKWRPRGFNDLAGQGPIVGILRNAISQGKTAHAYIFSGPRGIGKTSTARILSKAMNCKEGPTPSPCGVCASCLSITEGSSVDVIEIDGASNNSVDDIRELRERVKYAPSSSKYKIYIIDEAHMLSNSAFNALLKTLEEPPSHVIFVLATTALKKIPATIISRCQHMPFRRISSNEIRERLRHISDSEGISISSQALGLISRAADGSMRDSLTILDQLFSFTSDITEDTVKDLIGITDMAMLLNIAKAVIEGDRPAILRSIHMLSENGADIKTFTRELVQFFRDLLIASIINKPEDILDLNPEEISSVKELIKSSSEDQLTLMLSEIMKAETDVRNSSSPRLAIEMSLVKASFLSAMKPLRKAIEHIDRYGRYLQETGGDMQNSPEAGQNLSGKSHAGKIINDIQDVIAEPDKPVKSDGSDGSAAPFHTVFENSEETGTDAADSSGASSEGGSMDIIECWERAIDKIPAPLASKISGAAAEVSDGELLLTLNGGHAVFEDDIRKNLRSIEKIVSGEAGKEIKIKIESAMKKPSRKKGLREKVREEAEIKEALELFEGRIVEVKPTKKQ